MIPTKISSLVLLRQNGKVLLGLKKRGFGCGKWNGFGGKIEEGETMLECAKRELFEESGLKVDHLDEQGYLEFQFVNDPLRMLVHVFTGSSFTGTPIETDEMLPQWFPENALPLDQMWADDRYWIPLLLQGKRFRGFFKFLDNETILQHTLNDAPDLIPPKE